MARESRWRWVAWQDSPGGNTGPVCLASECQPPLLASAREPVRSCSKTRELNLPGTLRFISSEVKERDVGRAR